MDKGCVFSFAIRRAHATGPDIEPILHPVFIPLILLGKRNLQSIAFLLPLRHEGTAAILGNKLVFTDLLGLSLKLITFTECANVRFCTIRQIGPTKLAQSKDTIWSEVMKLYLKPPRRGEETTWQGSKDHRQRSHETRRHQQPAA